MFLNGRELEPFDPFHSSHPATILGPEEVFRLGDQEIRMQPVTLPHHKKVSTQEWERYAGPEGYVRNQGFYVYRGKRLIIHGTWFKLMRQTELTKLARVRIDMPNSMDSDWKIDSQESISATSGACACSPKKDYRENRSYVEACLHNEGQSVSQR